MARILFFTVLILVSVGLAASSDLEFAAQNDRSAGPSAITTAAGAMVRSTAQTLQKGAIDVGALVSEMFASDDARATDALDADNEGF